jgi:PAS domain S-box-containing protein
MTHFHRAFPIALAISDADGEWLVKEGWSECCTQYFRVHPTCQQVCHESNNRLAGSLRPNEYACGPCGHGLMDVAAPIMAGGQQIATLWLGQFFTRPPDLDYYRQYAARYGFPEEKFLDAIAQCPIYNPEDVALKARFFIRFCEFLVEASMQRQGRMKAEEALAASERNFRSLAESSPDAIMRYDEAQRISYLNNRLVRDLSLDSAEAVLGRTPNEVWPDRRYDVLERAAADIVADGNPRSIEMVWEATPGRMQVAQVSLVAEHGEAGDILGAIAFGRDITAIREGERRLAHFIENLPGMAYTFKLAPDGRASLPYASSAIEALFGLRPEDVQDDASPLGALTHPEDYPRLKQAMVEAIRQMSPLHAEFRVQRPGYPERWLECRSTCERQADGSILGYGIMLDITGRKALDAQLALERLTLEQRVEARTAELKASQQRFLRLVNNIGDQFVIFSFLPTGEFLYVSDGVASVMGVRREAVIGKRWSEVFNWLPEDIQRGESAVHHLMHGTLEFAQIEMRFLHPDGSERVLQCTSHAVLDERGMVLSIDGIAEDVTERHWVEVELRQAKEAAEVANRAKSQFLAAASHDLRQPIQAISLYLSTLQNMALDGQQQTVCDRLLTATATLNSMLDGILDISKLDAGVIKPNEAAVELFDIIEKLENDCVPLAAERKLEFRLFFPIKSITLRTDRTLLLIMLRNIVGNAIKYTQTGGLLVGVRERRAHLDFEVWDTGPGIAEEDIPRIFDEFVQVGNPQRDRAKGLGLGLAIVKRLANLLGYEIHCRSRLARGSVFKLRVPRRHALDRDMPSIADPVETMPKKTDLKGLRVVLIEDDALVSQALEAWLGAQGVRALRFADGRSALAHPNIAEADVYISDFRLPGEMNGVDVLDAIQRDAGRSIHGIIITGDTEAEKVSGLARTRWTLFHKPVMPERLGAAIAAFSAAPVAQYSA